MKKIESKENNFFKNVKKLKEKRTRKKENKYIIEGFRFVEEAIKSKAKIDSIIISESVLDKALEYFDLLGDFECYVFSDNLFNQICSTENPQGVASIINMENEDLKINGDFFILVDRVQDPGNMGTIIRTSHAAGANGVILTKGTVDVYNDKTLRSTMGSIFKVPIIEDDNGEFLLSLKNNGFRLVASSLEGKNNFFEEDLKGKIIIAVGNEGNGISEDVENDADALVKIPMPGNAESLNVSVAASIMIYEKIRQNIISSIE